MISDPVWLALIVAIPTLIGTVVPVMVLRMNNRNTLKMKLQDAQLAAEEREQNWARLDAVAAAAAASSEAATAAGRNAAAAAIETARLLVLNTEAVTGAGQVAHNELQKLHRGQEAIHTLVNSHLTSEMKRTLVALMEIISLRKALGQTVSMEALAEIAELQAVLRDRAQATAVADSQNSVQPEETRAGGA